MENVKYAIEIVDKWGKPFENFRRDINSFSNKKVADPFRDIPKSLTQLRNNLDRYKQASDNSFRTDHIKKYGILIDETKRKISELEGTAAKAGKTTGDILKSIAGWGAAMMVGRAVYQFGNDSLKASAQVEKYAVTLKTMLGSQGAARERMAEYSDIAMKTPFELSQVVEAGNKLQAIGRYSKSNLIQLGDLAAASGKPIEQVMDAYAKLSTGQKGEGVNMFRDLLISTDDWVKATGKGITKNGELIATTEEMIAALPVIMKSKNFTGMMDEQSRTTEGRISNLKDSIFQLKVAVGDTMKPAFDSFLNSTTGIINSTRQWVEIPTAEKIAREKAELNSLVGIITNANTGEAQRKSLLLQLTQQYPEFLGNLDVETVTNEKLIDKLKGVNEQYKQKMQYAGMKDFVTKEETELQKLYKEQTRIQTYIDSKKKYEKEQKYLKDVYGVEADKLLGITDRISGKKSDAEIKAEQMQKRVALNPNDNLAKNYLDHYREMQGQASIVDASFSYTGDNNNPEKDLKKTNDKIIAQEFLVGKYEEKLTEIQRKNIYQQAKGINIDDKSTFDKLFGSKKLAGDFNTLVQTPYEKLKTEDIDKLSNFLSGNLKYVAPSGGSGGNGVSNLDKATDVITGGGRNVKQINITIDKLVENINNSFEPGQNPADATDFMNKLTAALQSVVNDTNYSN